MSRPPALPPRASSSRPGQTTTTPPSRQARSRAGVATVIGQNGQAIGTGRWPVDPRRLPDHGRRQNELRRHRPGSLSVYGQCGNQPGRQRRLDKATRRPLGRRDAHGDHRLRSRSTADPSRRHVHDHHRVGDALTGSGTTASPNFAGPSRSTATSGTIYLGPGTGSISVGRHAACRRQRRHARRLHRHDAVTASSAAAPIAVASAEAQPTCSRSRHPATFTTDQNHSITFQSDMLDQPGRHLSTPT